MLLDGKRCAAALRARIAQAALGVKERRGTPPHLAAVLVGNDRASNTYVNAKVKACGNVGFRSTLLRRPETTTQAELLALVQQLNKDQEVDGFIVQLPLPSALDEQAITLAIDPRKDVDGFHPDNIGRMVLGLDGFLPATPSGICELLRFYSIETAGKHCVVVGRSNIVGTPMSILMGRNAYPGNCTVTLAHSRTKDLAEVCRQADILIVAAGKAGLVDASMVKHGAVVVDVGIHRLPHPMRPGEEVLAGDVRFDEVAPKCLAITPVPGGVGPMTIASLLLNTLKACGHTA
jgi:methylenetetrahydrofolate dehydrogenase (NADP+) / methenyltetrahydrofolate cyclohydrolase